MRFAQCTEWCTTDCGHCKGRPVEAIRTALAKLHVSATAMKQTIDAFPDANNAANLAHARTQRDISAFRLLWYQRRVAALGALAGPMHAPSQPLRRELEATAARINHDGTWRPSS